MDNRNGVTYRAITGGRSPRTEVDDWQSGLAFFIRLHGSETAAARALDVPRRTLRNWLGKFGRTIVPPADRKARVIGVMVNAQRRARLKPGREKRLRAAKTITVEGTDRYDGAPRTTVFTVGKGGSLGITADVMTRLVDAYLNGANAGPENLKGNGLAGYFTRRILDPWYRDFYNTNAPDWGIDIDKVTIK